jgi:hypothetical protein
MGRLGAGADTAAQTSPKPPLAPPHSLIYTTHTMNTHMTIEDLAKIMKIGFDSVDQRFDVMDQRFDVMDQRFDVMDRRFETMDQRFDAMDIRFLASDQRADSFEQKLTSLKEEVMLNGDAIAKLTNHIEAETAAHISQTERFEKRFDHVDVRLERIEGTLRLDPMPSLGD